MDNETFGSKILIVEDNADTRLYLSEVLRKAGYAPIEASSGEEGLALFAECGPDLVVLDVMLPGMDGWDVLQKIKRGPRSGKVPVVMLTGLDLDEDKVKGYRFGADFYLTKPVGVNNILAVVARVLRERATRAP